jgi:hypothetical protein
MNIEGLVNDLQFVAYELDDANPYQYCVDEDEELTTAIVAFADAIKANHKTFPGDLTAHVWMAEFLAWSMTTQDPESARISVPVKA